MEIRSILVHVGLGSQRNAVGYAARLAEAYGAEVVGLAAAQPGLVYSGVDAGQIAVDYYAAQSKAIEGMLVRAEEAFRAQMPPTVPVKWRSYIANTTAMLIEQARRCDILVAASGDVLEPGESLDAGQLILGSGRPVIMVGDHADAFSLGQVVIAWKDSREARRAVADAIPLLQRAKRIKAVTYSEGDGESEAASLSDLIAWLGRHGVHAEGLLVKESLEFFDAMEPLTKGAPDLIVAGGYGHSRFREWLLGGVTNDLLNARSVNRLFSN